MNIKNTLSKAGMTLKKHSPLLFTVAGVVGIGATAYLAYKSRDKVEAVVVNLEEDRRAGIEVDKMEVAKDLAEALYLPVFVGALSVTAFVMSYKIQNGRITTLAGALAAQQARNLFFENKYRTVHGEEEYSKFIAPTETVIEEVEQPNGKTKKIAHEIKQDLDKTLGMWYSESTEFVSDDHGYNVAMIESVEEKLHTILFQRGHLLLNEVYDAFGFERTRAGALLGWSAGDVFRIDRSVINNTLPNAEIKTDIWLAWSSPRYVFDELEFSGRYSPF